MLLRRGVTALPASVRQERVIERVTRSRRDAAVARACFPRGDRSNKAVALFYRQAVGEGGVRVEAVRVEGGVPPLWRPSDGRVNPPIITTGNYNFSFCCEFPFVRL